MENIVLVNSVYVLSSLNTCECFAGKQGGQQQYFVSMY